jgi:hypothetical protein
MKRSCDVKHAYQLNLHGRLVVNLCVKSRKDFQIFLLICVFPVIRDFSTFNPALLLRLSHFHPLRHVEIGSNFGKGISCFAKTLEERTVFNWVQNDMVIGPR